jgi:hypothetical protein
MTPAKTPSKKSSSAFEMECAKWMGCLPARERVKLEAAVHTRPRFSSP